ncbi:type II toxin-antitoxin system RelE/ParE family toxin [Rhodopirellula sp. P2]|uniref:type II toxin-antitoxin system RelE/ParE family toxin n=1 Tax=Rhodopirellula sp. P2 TaxID=2127060 RepID=UPI002367E64E|nr:type II toxin-antitoxin system RelE/ParE family toxin [Rhodopirellula sp. P2]WDQ18633.1 type II toxin-antitoxin system RelE/ParE family toxin [Rhodopirellula sp. P2]
MPRLIIAPSARRDLSDIYDYIARDKPIAAANWVEKIEGKCKLIATTPEFGERRPEYGADIRSNVVGRYVIFFRPIENGIEVASVIAGDRDIRSL